MYHHQGSNINKNQACILLAHDDHTGDHTTTTSRKTSIMFRSVPPQLPQLFLLTSHVSIHHSVPHHHQVVAHHHQQEVVIRKKVKNQVMMM